MEKSEQTKKFKENLPDSIKNNASVSLSYKTTWEIIVKHLMSIYGDYANPEINIKKFIHNDLYKKQCHKVKKIKSIPILNFDDIKKMIEEDELYLNQISKLLELKEKYTKTKSNNKKTIFEMASILGIMPDDNAGLFNMLVNKKEMSIDEKRHFNKIISESVNILEIVVISLSDFFTNGFLVEFDSVGSVMTQPHRKYFYRGENAYFNSSRPSLYRNVNKTNALECEILGSLRLYECWGFFDRFNAVKSWRYNSINYMALAQHYGLKTQMIDITTNLKAALFFACCKFGKDKKWHPLDKSDFAHRNSRPNISKDNGNSKFGVLYRSPTELMDLKWSLNENNPSFELEKIIPVGYQPFMRCSSQNAYMLLAKSMSYDAYNDETFEKYRFCLTEEICNWIYEEMDFGKGVYPNADIPDISNEVESINNTTGFSQKVYDTFKDDLKNQGIDKKTITKIFSKFGITVNKSFNVIDEDRLNYINNKYTLDTAEKLIGLDPAMRPMLILPSDTMLEICED